MTLYTEKDFRRNEAARINTVESILNLENLVAMHNEAGRPALKKNALTRLANAHFELYMLNKDYDEMLVASMTEEFPERKSIIKTLLRK